MLRVRLVHSRNPGLCAVARWEKWGKHRGDSPDPSGTIKHQKYWITQQILTHVQTPSTSLAGGASDGPTRPSTLRPQCPYLSSLDLSCVSTLSLSSCILRTLWRVLIKLFPVDFLSTFPVLFPSPPSVSAYFWIISLFLPLPALVAPGPWACGSLVISSSLCVKIACICLARTLVVALEAALISHNELVI